MSTELATVGAGYLGCALVRLAIHVAAASPGGHRIPVMQGHLPALDHGVMDPAPAEERTS